VVIRLGLQVANARAELRALRKSIDEMREAERATRAEIEAMPAKCPPERTESQRNVIRSLVNEIRAIDRKNAALNREVEELEAEADRRALPFERQIECDAIAEIAGQLDGKRHRFYDKCTEFIDIRSQQLKDVVTVEDLSSTLSGRRITEPELPPARGPAEEEQAVDGDWASGSEEVQIG
jgi:predicted  nucleic acid-binding Zn-ribbon protein